MSDFLTLHSEAWCWLLVKLSNQSSDIYINMGKKRTSVVLVPPLPLASQCL